MQNLTLFRLIGYSLSFHKYPRYFVDFLLIPLVRIPFWRRQGMMARRSIKWQGMPIISIFPNSKIMLGHGCVFCSRSSQTALGINHPVVLRTLQDGAVLSIGDGVRMSGATICAAQHIAIGDRCVIGANVTIVDTDFHSLDPSIRSTIADRFNAKVKAVEIGCDVFIGGGSFILKGVTIGDGVVIGAGSVVSCDVAPGAVVAGNPSRQVSQLNPEYINNLSLKSETV